MKKSGKIKGIDDTKCFMEDAELVREYFQTDRLTFGVSELLPGKIGGLDPGHSEADEVFYCTQGHVLCYFPEEDEYYELKKNDALLIPEGVGHKLYNIGEEKAVIIFCCAPHP